MKDRNVKEVLLRVGRERVNGDIKEGVNMVHVLYILI
jgi:hypothetical protein